MPAAANTNLGLWDGFFNTDPQFCKQFNRGGFKGTAINAVYVIKKLTERFGPVGIGWRLVVDDEKYVQGHAFDGANRCIIHVLRGHLEYRDPISPLASNKPEWVATGPQYGQTTFVGQNKNGCFTDEEAPKKSATDLLGKCALQLGIGADISMGLWDDNKYVADAGDTAAAPKARAPRKTPDVATATPGVDLTNIETAIVTAENPAGLLTVFNDLRNSTAIYNDLPTWEIVCNRIATKYTKLNQPADPASVMILGQLQAERLRLDAGTNTGASNAQPVQQASGNVPAPSRRTRRVPT